MYAITLPNFKKKKNQSEDAIGYDIQQNDRLFVVYKQVCAGFRLSIVKNFLGSSDSMSSFHIMLLSMHVRSSLCWTRFPINQTRRNRTKTHSFLSTIDHLMKMEKVELNIKKFLLYNLQQAPACYRYSRI